MLHVELLRNEWSGGQQRVLARLVLNGTGGISFDGPDEWREAVLQPFHDPETSAEVSPDDGEQFLRALHRRLDGDYVFATEAHELGECEYEVGASVPMRSASFVTAPDEAHAG